MKKEGTEMVITWSPVADQGTGEQAGVFIIRIWKEPGSPSGFRARIIHCSSGRLEVEGP